MEVDIFILWIITSIIIIDYVWRATNWESNKIVQWVSNSSIRESWSWSGPFEKVKVKISSQSRQ